MKIEYSQTMIFNKDTMEVIGKIEESHGVTAITFDVPEVTQDFFEVCRTWDLFESRLTLKNDTLTYFASQSSSNSYEYSKFMSLIVSFFDGTFTRNFKVTKNFFTE